MSHDLALDLAIDEILSNYGVVFNHTVDLGCGNGTLGYILKKYTNWLVGVDLDCGKLEEAYNYEFYGEVVCADVRDFKFDSRTDSVSMFELIEHLPKQDGLNLLVKTQPYFTMVSTPEKFYVNERSQGTPHLSLWTEDDFASLGFNNIQFVKPFHLPTQLFGGDIIIAVRSK